MAGKVTTKPAKTTVRGRGPNGKFIAVPITAKTKITEKPKREKKTEVHVAAPVTEKKRRGKKTETTASTIKMTNHIALVIDKSGSMGSLRSEMVSAVNGFGDVIRDRAAKDGSTTTVSLITFSGIIKTIYLGADASALKTLTTAEYCPDGTTALLDAVGMTVEELRKLPNADDPSTSFLVIALTDGEENASTRYNKTRLAALLNETEKDGRWTVAFHVPKGGRNYLTNFGIKPENIREWEQTKRGVDETSNTTAIGISGFFDARATGKTKVDKFFTDLSKVSVTQVKTKLVDVSKQYKLFTVDREVAIKEFVEEKTKKPYVLGSAFYELTKPETVQPQKDVLIVERGKEKNAIYGGVSARDMLGLPQGAHAKLTPANLSIWRPLIKSTSPNRKLVRGTILAVDVTKIKPDDAHFDLSVLDPK